MKIVNRKCVSVHPKNFRSVSFLISLIVFFFSRQNLIKWYALIYPLFVQQFDLFSEKNTATDWSVTRGPQSILHVFCIRTSPLRHASGRFFTLISARTSRTNKLFVTLRPPTPTRPKILWFNTPAKYYAGILCDERRTNCSGKEQKRMNTQKFFNLIFLELSSWNQHHST